ncbi:hypothetical protein Fcan01_21735 [Folsomia candida]|uniref:Uncharacterized protein n=1 Tax=Folsomia candida TaxID=158441 RepID=A0A226DEI0_FOLCA|nr:hypothetical protein Fcan01_21735 [Folsomia candida]
MAPIDKFVAERDAVADTLEYIDSKVKAHQVTPVDGTSIPILLEEVASCRVKLHEIHLKIRTLCPNHMGTHKQDLFLLLNSADSIHNALHGIQASLPITNSSTNSSTQQIRLPKLDLKAFDGSILEWTSFRDLFTASIHSNTTISKGQKLTYLKSYLKGEPAKLIQSMVLSDANYDIAWQQLHDRYQNDREILFAILRRFYNQPAANSSSSIRSLVDTSKECQRSLQILNLNTDKTTDAMMLFTILNKLDHTSRELWEQSLKGNSIPTLAELFEFMEQRARALAAGPKPRNSSKPEPSPTRAHVHHTHTESNCKVCGVNPHPI